MPASPHAHVQMPIQGPSGNDYLKTDKVITDDAEDNVTNCEAMVNEVVLTTTTWS